MTLGGTWRRGALVILMGAALVACGDDDDGRPVPMDSGVDSSTGGDEDGGGGGGGTDAGDAGGGGGRVCSIVGGECDAILQNCPQAAQACYVLVPSEGAAPTTLCDTAGTAAEGAACTTYSDCLPGLTCDRDDMRCRSYCCEGRNSDCPAGTGQICISYSNAMPLGQCDPPSGCTLIPQGGCGDGQGCYIIADDGTTDCRPVPAGSVGAGETCGPTTNCLPGTACFTPSGGGAGTCRQLCRTGMDGDCAAGGTCMAAGGLPSGLGACQ